MSIEFISYLLELKKKLFTLLRWPVDKLEELVDNLIKKIASFMIQALS